MSSKATVTKDRMMAKPELMTLVQNNGCLCKGFLI